MSVRYHAKAGKSVEKLMSNAKSARAIIKKLADMGEGAANNAQPTKGSSFIMTLPDGKKLKMAELG